MESVKSIIEGIISEIGATVVLGLAGGIPIFQWYTHYRDQVSFFELTFTVLLFFIIICIFIYPILGIELSPTANQVLWLIVFLLLLERSGILLRMRERNLHKGERDGSRTGREGSP